MTDTSGDWQITWFQEALADIRWAKERSWSITYAAVVLIAAIYTVGERLSERPLLFTLAAAMTSIGAMTWIVGLNRFAAKARAYVHGTLRRVAHGDRGYPKRQARDPNHAAHLVGQLGVLAAASASVSVLLHDSLGVISLLVTLTPIGAVAALPILARRTRDNGSDVTSIRDPDSPALASTARGGSEVTLASSDDA